MLSVYAEVSLDARRISYDSRKDTISAEEEVLIKQLDEFGNKKRELQTDRLEYNRKTGIINFYGKTVLRERTGEIITSNSIKIDDNLKNGIIKTLSIIMKDRAWIDAEYGEKNGDLYSLSKATYSPCYENKNCSVPLWDLYADKVVYDSKNKTLTYNNVRLRMKGHTILYSPYFSHPSFEVKRKSGFVTPIIHANNDTGTLIGIPYFWAVSTSQNFKITPFINFRRRALMVIEYKEALPHGDFSVSSSGLSRSHNKKEPEEERKNRWSIALSYRTINIPNKRLIFDIDRASDVTYLIKYPVSQKYAGSIIQRKCNTSKVGMEFFDDNYFLDMKTYLFQTPNKETSPFVFPKINFQYEKEDILKGTAFFSSDFLGLSRNKSDPCKDLGRFSNKIGWKNEIPHSSGIILDISTAVRIDSYFANCREERPNKNNISKSYPILENGLACSYPIYSDLGRSYNSIWGPRVALSSMRTSRNRYNLHINEDSIFDHYNDLNLFNLNKSTGIDTIENGEKITYGVENSIYKESGRRLFETFIGKMNMLNYREEKSKAVGRLVCHPSENFSIRTRFVGLPFLEPLKMFEMGSNFKFKKFNFDCAYFGENRMNKVRKYEVSQVGCSLGYQVSRNWSVSCSQVFNFKRKAGNRNLSRAIFCKYKDECFEFGFGIYKCQYKDMDLKRKTGLMLTFAFRNLCEISQSSKKYEYRSLINNIE